MIEWKIPPAQLSMRKTPSTTAHAHEVGKVSSLCKQFSDMDKGTKAFDSDRKCPRCLHALEEELLQRLGKKTKTNTMDEMIRAGEFRARMTRAPRKTQCVWGLSPQHWIEQHAPAIFLESNLDDDKGYVCIPCWDEEKDQ